MSEAERAQALTNVLRTCVLVVFVESLSAAYDANRYGWPLALADLLHALQGGVVGVLLHRSSSRITVRTCDRVFAFVVVPFLVTIWLPQIYELRSGTLVEPLLAHHFLLLALAIMSPSSLRWGLSLLAVFTAHGVALWGVLAAGSTHPSLEREPWFTLLFAAIAGGILWSRSRRRALADRLAASEARAEALAQVNRALVALRDRANTPLQTLELALSVLERASQDHGRDAAIGAMRRALESLVTAQGALSRIAPVANVEHGALNIDLEREIVRLREGATAGR